MKDAGQTIAGDLSYAINERNRVRRMRQNGSYAQADLFAVLDASPLSHIGYVIDGQPFVTPTLHWRAGNRLFWHGSAASRFLKEVNGLQACLTATIVDGYVVARSMFEHSINYRSAMVFGIARQVTGADQVHVALRHFSERFFPGRWDRVRPITPKELRATAIVQLDIEDASVKVRRGPPNDAADSDWPVWAGVLPTRTVFGPPEPAPDMPSTITDSPPASPFAFED
jgi:nitroimidazol reductase NimA-like FMN-containing flavoprotein (pyridoxamine 5'-phosphate oxidase superfamily)